jgi:hypothetical protein
MRRHGLTLGELTAFGGEDLSASNPTRKEKARRAAKTWALMARLGITHADLADAEPLPPDNSTRRRRGGGVFAQVVENTEKPQKTAAAKIANEVNGLATSAPVGDPAITGSGRCLGSPAPGGRP